MTDRDALREALTEALRTLQRPDRQVVTADAILAHPAVLVALERSGPAEGLPGRIDAMYVGGHPLRDYSRERRLGWDEAIATVRTFLAATPTASPTEDEP